MLKIGQTFASELAAAGVPLDGVSWDCCAGVIVASDGAAHLSAAQAVLAKHDPTRRLPWQASAKQVRYAINDIGVRAAWNAAVMASDQPSQDYWTSADPMFEANGKIAKWCAAAGITPKQLFDQAVTE